MPAFQCKAGDIYSIQSNGDLKYINSAGNVSQAYDASDNGTSGSSMNGLGIGAGGTTAFWYERSNNSDDIDFLVKYASGTVTKVSPSSFDTNSGNSLVTGALSPSGEFLFGKFVSGTGGTTAFQLYAYTSTGYKQLGTVTDSGIPSGSGGLNGDMAFDAAGNLYIVGSTDPSGGQVNVNITLVTSAQITAAIAASSSSHQIAATSVSQQTITAATGFNGVAFDSAGYVYVGNGTTLRKYDPSTWNLVATVTTNLGDSTDLSSCAYPPTLALQKNLPNGRTLASDQFTLTISRSNDTVATNTTTGSASGVQPDKAGPTPVVSGQTYKISEVGATSGSGAGTDLGLYTSSVQCIDTANNNQVVNVAADSTLSIPSTSGATVVCTFTNIPKVGVLKITKAFDNSVPSGSGTSTTFSGNWVCTLGSGSSLKTVASGTWTRQGTGDATLSAAGSGTAADKIPDGASCTATENTLPTTSTGLPDASWAWDTPSVSAAVTIVAGTTKTITVTNKAKRVLGNFQVKKVLAGGSTADASNTYTGTWVCTVGSGSSQTSVNGTWGSIAAGATWSSSVSNAIPLGATCNVTTEVRPDWPVANDHSYVWDGDPTISAGVTSTSAGTNTVTVTNTTKRQVGSATWTKSADDNAKTLLAGSTWKLNGPSVPANTIVTDCVQSPCATGAYKDQDPAAGKFSITNILFGAYTLTEQAAPPGYVTDSTVHAFTVASTTNVSVGNFTNKQQTPLAIPLTGGLSADWMYIGGAGIAVLAIMAAGGQLWRGRRQQ